MATCPYCAEPIKDEATACRYCSRDFAPLKPLQARVRDLESELVEAKVRERAAISAVEAEPSRARIPIWLESRNRLPAIAAVGSYLVIYALFTVGSEWVWAGFLPDDFLFRVTSIYMFLIGAWLGFSLRRTGIATSFLAGAILAAALVWDESYHHIGESTALIWMRVRSAVPQVGAGALLMTATGGLVGYGIKLRSQRAAGTDPARDFARILLRKTRQLGSSDAEQRLDRLTKIVIVVTPMLTFAGTVIGAYLSYLGTLNAARK